MSKHDAGCMRRKVEMNFPYLCTCDMTDAQVRPAVRRHVDLDELDVLAGDWRSVHNLLMEAAVHARLNMSSKKDTRYAQACEAVATRLSNP